MRRILDPVSGRAFLADLLPFQARIARIGAVNGLAQTLLKLTAPGVPDTYQGTELWDLSLVDPDNRRPVDFALRERWLAAPRPAAELLRDWRSGRIKQHVVARTLALRRRLPELFSQGEYLPLTLQGAQAERIVAFARRRPQAAALVIVPRLVAGLLPEGDELLPPRGGLGRHRDRAAGGLGGRRCRRGGGRRAHRPQARAAGGGRGTGVRAARRLAGGPAVGRGGHALTARRGGARGRSRTCKPRARARP